MPLIPFNPQLTADFPVQTRDGYTPSKVTVREGNYGWPVVAKFGNREYCYGIDGRNNDNYETEHDLVMVVEDEQELREVLESLTA